jgi:hypothetical protein
VGETYVKNRTGMVDCETKFMAKRVKNSMIEIGQLEVNASWAVAKSK